MRVSDLLLDRQLSLFVGREEQLDLLTRIVTSPEWQLVNIYGPGGIGKTTLLRMFARTIDPARRIYLDGYSGFRRPEDFLAKIRTELSPYMTYPLRSSTRPNRDMASAQHTLLTDIERINEYADRHPQGIVLMMDAFEQYGAIESWLRTEFLSRLSPGVKVILAGRYALMGEWQRGEWSMLVYNVELKSLTHAEIVKYTRKRDIQSRDTAEALARFSRGVPLALSLACEIIVRNGTTAFLNQSQQQQETVQRGLSENCPYRIT